MGNNVKAEVGVTATVPEPKCVLVPTSRVGDSDISSVKAVKNSKKRPTMLA